MGGGGGKSLYKMTGRMFKASIVPLALYQQQKIYHEVKSINEIKTNQQNWK